MAATIKDLGKVTAYAYAKAAGYTGTEEQFQAIFNEFTENAPGLMDRIDTAVARAEAAVANIDATVQDAVDDAVEEATASAVATANQAVTDAQAAQTAAEGAVTQANAAVTQANAAVTAAQAAQSAAEDAAESFVLDRTLTDSGAAAPADLVGDLKESFAAPVSFCGIEWLSNGYYGTDAKYHGSTAGTFKTSAALPCWPGENMIIYGLTNSTSVACVTFFNLGGTSIVAQLSNIGDAETEVHFTVPDGAYCFRLSTTAPYTSKTYIRWNRAAWDKPVYLMHKKIEGNEAGLKALSVAYVDGTNGADTNAGTESKPFATINKALAEGYRNLMVAPGIYPEAINLQNEEFFSLRMIDVKTTFDTSAPNRDKVILFRGTALTPTASGSAYTVVYTPEPGSDIDKVFVTREVTPTASGSYATEYNANAFLYKPGFDSVRLLPVLPEFFDSTPGTFTYANGNITFVPFARDAANIEGAKLYVPQSLSWGIRCRQVGRVDLSDVVSLGNYYYGISLENVQAASVSGCEALCTTHGTGFRANNTNVDYKNCKGCGNQTDGFGFSFYGESILENCHGLYNADDGCSHHHGCRGAVVGGAFIGNGSGGVTPAFGADVNVENIYSCANRYGIALFFANGYPRQTIYASGCTLVNNTGYDVYNDGHDGIFTNCVHNTVYLEKGTNTFYGLD